MKFVIINVLAAHYAQAIVNWRSVCLLSSIDSKFVYQGIKDFITDFYDTQDRYYDIFYKWIFIINIFLYMGIFCIWTPNFRNTQTITKQNLLRVQVVLLGGNLPIYLRSYVMTNIVLNDIKILFPSLHPPTLSITPTHKTYEKPKSFSS